MPWICTIQALAVANNQLRSGAAVALVDAMCKRSPPTLQELDLSHNPITEGASADVYDAEVRHRT